MRIILLGTGTPVLEPNRQASAILIEAGDDKLLFDAGWGGDDATRAGIQPQHVNPLFITHHHYDHIGDLGELLLTAWYYGRREPLTVYGPFGTAESVAALLEQVYAREIAFTLFNRGIIQNSGGQVSFFSRLYLFNKTGLCSRGFHTSRACALWKARLRRKLPRLLNYIPSTMTI